MPATTPHRGLGPQGWGGGSRPESNFVPVTTPHRGLGPQGWGPGLGPDCSEQSYPGSRGAQAVDSARRRVMATIPTTGPGAKKAKAHRQPKVPSRMGISQMVATVKVKPKASCSASAVPT